MSHKSLIENLTILRSSHVEADENIRACIIDEAIQAITQLEQKLTESDGERVVMCLNVEHCDCGNVGFYVVPDGDGEPMQEQCRFCYTTPWSVFNVEAIKYSYEQRNDKTEVIEEIVPI